MADHDQIEQKINALAFSLPEPPKPVASYLPFVISDDLVFISGQLPSQGGKVKFCGKIPVDVSLDEAREAAKLATINALAVLKTLALDGQWNRLMGIVRLGVFVQSANDFYGQSQVANGASDLLSEIFGEMGRHARSAIGVNALPLNAAVEVEMVARITSHKRWRDHR